MKKNVKELMNKELKVLEKEKQELIKAIAEVKINNTVNKFKDTNTIAKKQKQLAVLLTIINQKKSLNKNI
ncbi:hypothetical protein AUK04_04625 [Candidatus Roizmanbacteria bacterium CG2_30_33_16]|uniref:50S ribosomal protein L29 n=5 Tax=Candidatus Roizmaniibacteriota TaxID=1752723 RepID=A0A2M7E5P3_9BACT|nr:hypothetical protein [Candidatus Roizmanbacteria bacterium]OIP82549.1 MAG: hypothetical protein AUK04_04625 [Candidatus Roizmanbacteria bacterium CG2_30_33_16]PIP64573.1 MAG: hypothetical protein COW96_01680 [Candidatus Roizmanbacteria bacterium CG22_combo_CG10-13_8_21_14_all_33_16]PIV63031.1 MAG: hypothetical protein COS12_00055 [Candidatus Roizmanbacteria bacterium CG01_land_8_20_14_3_00_33_9]PIX72312.1 MAG: hypothetical protein COZ39_02920 [Candidatus Roizmanbacteria bacterium CG_4_10_14_